MSHWPSPWRYLRFQLQRWRQNKLPSLHQAATNYMETDQRENARKLFEKILNIAPDDIHALSGLASIDADNGDFDPALQRWDGLLRRTPDNYWASIGRGQTLLEAGRFDLAEQAFSDARRRWPQAIEALRGYADTAQQAGRLEEGLRRWQAVLEQFPDDHWASIKYAGTLMDLGRYSEAEQCFRQALPGHQDELSTVCGHADALTALKRYPEAIERWQAINAHFPATELVMLRMANAYASSGELESAETLYLDVQQRWPKHMLAYHLHSRLLETIRRQGQA